MSLSVCDQNFCWSVALQGPSSGMQVCNWAEKRNVSATSWCCTSIEAQLISYVSDAWLKTGCWSQLYVLGQSLEDHPLKLVSEDFPTDGDWIILWWWWWHLASPSPQEQ